MGNSWIVTLALAQLNMFVLSMDLSDERLSPFWVYLRYRLVSGINKTETGPAMELRLNKIYKIGEERIFKEHGASSASFAGYRVVVVKQELATDKQHMLLIFLAQSTNGNLMAAPMLVSLFARVEYQEFAILLGYPVLHRPKIYQPEANEQVDNKLWAVAVVLAILLAVLSIHWMVFYAHHHFCKVAHFPLRIRSSNKEDEKERSSTHIKEREIGNKFGTRSESEPAYKEPHRVKLEGRSVQLHMTSSGSTLGAIGQPKRNQSSPTEAATGRPTLSPLKQNASIVKLHSGQRRVEYEHTSANQPEVIEIEAGHFQSARHPRETTQVRQQNSSEGKVNEAFDAKSEAQLSSRAVSTNNKSPEYELLDATKIDQFRFTSIRPILIRDKAHPDAVAAAKLVRSLPNMKGVFS